MRVCSGQDCSTQLNTVANERWVHTGFCSDECRNDEFEDVFPWVSAVRMDLPGSERSDGGVSYQSHPHLKYILGAKRALKQARRIESALPADVIAAFRRGDVPRFIQEEPKGFQWDHYFLIASSIDACVKFVEGEINRVLHDLYEGLELSQKVEANRLSVFQCKAEQWKRHDEDERVGYDALERLAIERKAQQILELLEREPIGTDSRCWQHFKFAKKLRNRLEHTKPQSWSEHSDCADRAPRNLAERLAALRANENPILHSPLGAGGIVIHDDMPMLERFVSADYGEWVHDTSFLFLKAFFETAGLERTPEGGH